MNKVIDLHHHLNTLAPYFNFRSRIQKHLLDIDDFIQQDSKTIINVAFYIPVYQNYSHLKQMIVDFKNELTEFDSRVRHIKNSNDLEGDYQLGLIFHVESARSLKSPSEQIPELFDLGVRGIIPVHFKDNHLGNSCDDFARRTGLKKTDSGLTDKGAKFVDLCNDHKIWLDLAHTSDQTADDILDLAKEVMVSHVGVRDILPYKRNKDVEFYRRLAQKNGVIGITPWAHLIGPQRIGYERQIDILVENNLSKNTCIGTDFGAPIKTHKNLKSPFDISKLLDKYESAQDMQWGNAFHFFKRALPN